MKCPEQELCNLYDCGDDRPPNHDVRDKVKCTYWIRGECTKMGESCNLEKVQRIKEDIRG